MVCKKAKTLEHQGTYGNALSVECATKRSHTGDGFLLADPHGCQSRKQEAAHSRLHTARASHRLGSGTGWAQLRPQEGKMAALQGT